MASLNTRLARGVAALFALTVMTVTANAQTSYTINRGGSVTLGSADQAGMCGGDMSNRNVSFTSGSVTVLGTGAGGSPISTFKSYIDQGWVVWTHNGDGATQVTLAIYGDAPCTNYRTITVNINQPPVVTVHPQSILACSGVSRSLISDASGAAATKQWQRSTDAGATWTNETGFEGYATDTLTFVTSTALNGLLYRNVYSNSMGADTTDAASFDISITSITVQPASATVCHNATATFTPTLTIVGTPSYQWQYSADGVTYYPVPGGTESSLSFTADVSLSGYRYRLQITNGTCGVATTDDAVLTVSVPPAVTTDPVDASVCSGQTASFTVTADIAASVQWQVSSDGGGSWADLVGETGAALSFTSDASQDGARYRAIVSASCGADTSAAALLSVGSLATITAQPLGTTICTGYSTTLSVTAEAGTSTMSYQWRKDGIDIADATASSYTIDDATEASAGSYDVVVTACSTPLTSSAAVVTVLPPPTLSVSLDRSVISSSVRALVPINATVATSGGCSTSVVLDEILSSEADSGIDPGDVPGDIVADSLGISPAERSFGLRAEAGASGRIYSVIYRITDGAYTARDTTMVIALPPTSTVASGPESGPFTLTEASPNPTSTSTSFSFSSAMNCAARVAIHAANGTLVRTLTQTYFGTGTTINWDLTNNAGATVAPGIYVYVVKNCGGKRSGAIIVQ